MAIINPFAPFNQGNVMRDRLHNEAASKGACHAFAIHWCSLMHAGPPHILKAKNRMAALTIHHGGANPVLQKVYGNAYSEPDRDRKTANDLLVSIHGLMKTGIPIDLDHHNENLLVETICNPQYSAMLYSFWWKKTWDNEPGHTIAFFRKLQFGRKFGHNGVRHRDGNGDMIIAFDPNDGEYWFRPTMLPIFFHQLERKYSVISKERLVYLKSNH